MFNTFGSIFRMTTYGESHGAAVGAVVDGCPAGLEISENEIQFELDRRRPGQSELTTPRNEDDKVEILSGIFQGKTLGTPISLMIKNKDQNPADYDEMKDVYRPGHADYGYDTRYGIRDHRGGGRSSNRESAARVATGAIAKKVLKDIADVKVLAWVDSIKDIKSDVDIAKVTMDHVESNPVRCPDQIAAAKMTQAILEAKDSGDSLGGVVKFAVYNCPSGLGAPLFKKITSELAMALMSINATRSFDIGLGKESTLLSGSSHNDPFHTKNGGISTLTNNAGGVLGGISNGNVIYGTVSFKPTSTIKKEQDTVNNQGCNTKLAAKGRHDPCVLPRAVPIVEAMISIALVDQILLFPIVTMERLKSFYS